MIGACTLRAAIQETNALPGPDTISFSVFVPDEYFLTIPGADEDTAASGDLDITDALVLNGTVLISDGPTSSTITPVTVVDAAGLDRVFDIIGAPSVEMSGLIIRNGDPTSAALSRSGGGIQNLAGTLTLTDSTVTANASNQGGGILSGGFLMLDNVSINANTAISITAGVGPGGAISNFGDMEMVRSDLSGNSAGDGGAIVSGLGNLSILASSLIDNEANGSGGAIFDNGDITITDTTIRGNSSGGSGGAIAHHIGHATLVGVTLTGNSSNDGGAILNGGGGVSPLSTPPLAATWPSQRPALSVLCPA